MKRITYAFALLALASSLWAQPVQYTSGRTWGFRVYPTYPFTCTGATSALWGATFLNSATGASYICNSTGWASVGGLSSPIAGDYVATGKWTFGSAADAANSVRLGETAGSIVFEGSSADDYETTLSVTNPTADRAITFPNFGGNVVVTAGNNVGNVVLTQGYGFDVGGATTNGSRYKANSTLTPDASAVEIGTTSNSLHVFEIGDDAYDFNNGPCGTSACTNPTLIGHSATQSTAQWWSLTHDASDAVIQSGTGAVKVLEATIGNSVTSIVSTATNDDPEYVSYQNRAETTDATATALHTIALADETVYLVEARVIARKTNATVGNGAGYILKQAFKRTAAGVATVIGVLDKTAWEDDATWDATLDVSGNNARVVVTGAASQTITWHVTLFVSKVSS